MTRTGVWLVCVKYLCIMCSKMLLYLLFMSYGRQRYLLFLCVRQYWPRDAGDDRKTRAWARLCNRDPHNCGVEFFRFWDFSS